MKPINTTAESIIYAFNDNPVLSIKADGYTKLLKINTMELDCEYIEELDLYLAFDVLNYKFKHKNTLFDRMNWLRGVHTSSIPKYECFTSLEHIKLAIDEDSKNLRRYLKTTKDTIKWFPKICFQMNVNFEEWCSLLKYEPTVPYKTDGWIINSIQTYKYKPLKYLTADLDISGNIGKTSDNNDIHVVGSGLSGICRCRWNSTSNMWEAYETRNDKKYPNPLRVVKQIEWLIQNQYDLANLSKFTKRKYYSESKIKACLTPPEERFLNISNEIFAKNLLEIVRRYPVANVLDIGCGNCKLRSRIVRNIINLPTITGVDCDPKCINMCRYISSRDKWYTGDMNIVGFKMDMFEIDIVGTFDLLILNNAIHYSDNNLYENIDKYTHDGSLVYIYGYDLDKMINDRYKYFRISFNIDKDRNEMYYTYPWLDKEGVDKIVSFADVENKLSEYGFTKVTLPDILDGIDIGILGLHTALVMRKSHIKNIQ